ncbi:MAG: hypothetical protein ACYTHK_18725 [Planctomycetota bacterium]|jgi:hypothetical protein
MRTFIILCLAALVAEAQSPERPAATRSAPKPLGSAVQPRVYPLMNANLTDKYGVTTKLVAFHRVSGENRFVGYLGAADIEVPYEKIKALKIGASDEPGGRMRADITLHSDKVVEATFDEREGEQLFAGWTRFGRITIYWRDIRRLDYTGRTQTTDLPKYGKPTGGVDVRLKDRDGVETELVDFRRGTGENYIAGLRGSMRVEVPLRIVKRAVMSRPARTPLLECEVELRGQRPIKLKVKRYEEVAVYAGRAEFGDLRIQLAEIRELVVHRPTPKLRDLDPVAAAEGREVEIGKNPKR